jgi:hypothetical protein
VANRSPSQPVTAKYATYYEKNELQNNNEVERYRRLPLAADVRAQHRRIEAIRERVEHPLFTWNPLEVVGADGSPQSLRSASYAEKVRPRHVPAPDQNFRVIAFCNLPQIVIIRMCDNL